MPMQFGPSSRMPLAPGEIDDLLFKRPTFCAGFGEAGGQDDHGRCAGSSCVGEDARHGRGWDRHHDEIDRLSDRRHGGVAR